MRTKIILLSSLLCFSVAYASEFRDLKDAPSSITPKGKGATPFKKTRGDDFDRIVADFESAPQQNSFLVPSQKTSIVREYRDLKEQVNRATQILSRATQIDRERDNLVSQLTSTREERDVLQEQVSKVTQIEREKDKLTSQLTLTTEEKDILQAELLRKEEELAEIRKLQTTTAYSTQSENVKLSSQVELLSTELALVKKSYDEKTEECTRLSRELLESTSAIRTLEDKLKLSNQENSFMTLDLVNRDTAPNAVLEAFLDAKLKKSTAKLSTRSNMTHRSQVSTIQSNFGEYIYDPEIDTGFILIDKDYLSIPAMESQSGISSLTLLGKTLPIGFISANFAVLLPPPYAYPKSFGVALTNGDHAKFLGTKTVMGEGGKPARDAQNKRIKQKPGIELLDGFITNVAKLVKDRSLASFFISYIKMAANSMITTTNPADTEIYRVLLLGDPDANGTLDPKTKYGQMSALLTDTTRPIIFAAFNNQEKFLAGTPYRISEEESFAFSTRLPSLTEDEEETVN